MRNKLIVGLIVLAISAFAPLSSLSSQKSDKADGVTISSENLIVLNGEVNGENVGAVITKAKALDAGLTGLTGAKEKLSGKKPLYLFLNTPGGSIQSGLELIEALKGIGRPVHTITLFAASMGFQIAQNLDDRLILKNGVLMSHHARGESSGEFGGSQPTQMQNRQKLWDDRVRELDEQTVARTKGKQTYESYTKEYDHEVWLTGTNSVKEGYADRIIALKCDSSLSGVTTNHVNFMGFDIAYDLDNCPINTSPMNVRVAAPGSDKNPLSTATLDAVKTQFLTSYDNKAKQVVQMYW
jgi:ATP-dependent Clp protease, protease subunit